MKDKVSAADVRYGNFFFVSKAEHTDITPYLFLLYLYSTVLRSGTNDIEFNVLKITLFVFISVCTCLLMTSCKKQAVLKSPRIDYFKTMKSVDSLLTTPKDSVCIRFIDSVYAKPNLTVNELYQKYDLKRGYYYDKKLKNYLMANSYCDSMINVLQGKENEPEYNEDLCNAYLVKGDALLALKRFDEAFHYYYKGKMIVDKTGKGNISSGYSDRLALNCYRQGKFKEAAIFFKQAYKERASYKPKSSFALFQQLAIQQELLDNTCLSYSMYGKLDSALVYYKKTLQAIEVLAATFRSPKQAFFALTAKGVAYGNIANAYYSAGDASNAEACWKRSIAINLQPGGENHDARLNQIKLARLYIAAGRLPEAAQVLRQLGKAINDIHDDKITLNWLKLQWDYFNKTKQLKPAYFWGNNYFKLKDSIDNAEKTVPSVDLGGEFKFLEQQHQNELLKKENTLKQLYLFVALLTAGAAFVIAFLIWQNWARSKRNITLLTELNRQISNHNEQMQEALTALEQSQEDNTRMMKIVAHDLRNPVGNMTNIAGVILDMPGLPAEQHELLVMLQTSGYNSLDLIGNLLGSNSRLENLTKEPVDIYVLLNYCVSLMNFKAKEKKQQILFESGRFTLMLNREKMWRVFSNLIGNAIKFSPENSVISILTEEKADAVLITVKDNGIGIPDDLKEKIFDMFTVAKRKGTANEQPFGMGLAIVKQVIEAHEGKIWFESRLNAGTTFYVELPKAAEKRV